MNIIRKAIVLIMLALAHTVALAGPVNVNTADAETIAAELDGIGLSKADAIVAYREQHGRFKSIAELSQVKGIGARILEINRDNIRLSDGD